MISNFPNEDEAVLIGLDQEAFEYFVNSYGKQFKRIYLYSCKFITDLSPLSKLPDLEYVDMFHNQRVESIWDMSDNLNFIP